MSELFGTFEYGNKLRTNKMSTILDKNKRYGMMETAKIKEILRNLKIRQAERTKKKEIGTTKAGAP